MTEDDIRRQQCADTLGRRATVTESSGHRDVRAWWPYPNRKGGVLAFAQTVAMARREVGLRMLEIYERGGDEASYVEHESIGAYLKSREVHR